MYCMVLYQWLFRLLKTKKLHPLQHVTFLKKQWPHWGKNWPCVSFSFCFDCDCHVQCFQKYVRFFTKLSKTLLICFLPASTSTAPFVNGHLYLGPGHNSVGQLYCQLLLQSWTNSIKNGDHPSPKNQGWENGAFWPSNGFIRDLGGRGHFCSILFWPRLQLGQIKWKMETTPPPKISYGKMARFDLHAISTPELFSWLRERRTLGNPETNCLLIGFREVKNNQKRP